MSLSDALLLLAICLGLGVLPIVDKIQAHRQRKKDRAEITAEVDRFWPGGPPAAGGSAA